MRSASLLLRTVFFCSALGALSSCILPPSSEPRLLTVKEAQLLEHARKGKQYALSGRLELAEREIRLALKLAPNRSALHNDLGFVLDAGGRPHEGIVAFQKALTLDPLNLSARTNLARSLYKTGRVHESVTELQQVADIYTRLRTQPAALAGVDFSPRDYVAVLQNLAFANALLGFDDDAVCHAQKALAEGQSIFGAKEYARFLLALGRVHSAREVLAKIVTDSSGNAAPKVLLDYGVTLFLSGESAQAALLFERVTDELASDPDSRKYAQVLNSLSRVNAEARSSLGQTPVSETEGSEREELCSTWHGVRVPYWPAAVSQKVEKAAIQLCGDSLRRDLREKRFPLNLLSLLPWRENSL